eukprot:1449339-Pyramimonas_sp.AAC.1
MNAGIYKLRPLPSPVFPSPVFPPTLLCPLPPPPSRLLCFLEPCRVPAEIGLAGPIHQNFETHPAAATTLPSPPPFTPSRRVYHRLALRGAHAETLRGRRDRPLGTA